VVEAGVANGEVTIDMTGEIITEITGVSGKISY
jgi:hypothetical protein